VHRLASSKVTEREHVEKRSDNEILFIFVTSGGKGTAKNISELHKIM
jgi:hypothetical protein